MRENERYKHVSLSYIGIIEADKDINIFLVSQKIIFNDKLLNENQEKIQQLGNMEKEEIDNVE